MRYLVSIVFLLVGIICDAQEMDYINSDRPDYSEGVYIMPKNKWQIENGFTFYKNQVADNLMIRYSILDGTELRFQTDFSKIKNEKLSVDDVIFSFKQRLVEEKNGLPAITLVGYLGYKNDEKWGTDVYLAFENTLSERFTLDYNIGSSDYFKTLDITTELIYSPTEKTNFFIEYMGNFSNAKLSHNVDMGVMYIIKPNFQVDIAMGRNIITKNSFFTTLGASYRFD